MALRPPLRPYERDEDDALREYGLNADELLCAAVGHGEPSETSEGERNSAGLDVVGKPSCEGRFAQRRDLSLSLSGRLSRSLTQA